MDELENLQQLLNCISTQTYKNFELFVCVNQPDEWWNIKEKISICERNILTIDKLHDVREFPVTIIDRSSRGRGWNGKHFGVGWARKTIVDEISGQAAPNDILISMDGDIEFESTYFESVATVFDSCPDAVALSIPYYHRLTNDEQANRAILRYEIYMRNYAINMLRIRNPYAFTALGSAIAVRVSACRSMGGITPHKSGEDFYFLQKLRKFGKIIISHHNKVYPAARFSDRVFFGTGPAMIKGKSGDWRAYPIYNYRLFDEVKQTFDSFSGLLEKDFSTPMTEFLINQFGKDNLWKPLRVNYKNKQKFIRACKNKIDGLRILQYLKWKHRKGNYDNENNLLEFLKTFYRAEAENFISLLKENNLKNLPVKSLDELRNFLTEKEEFLQKEIFILNN